VKKKLPSIFQNDKASLVENNEKVYYSMYKNSYNKKNEEIKQENVFVKEDIINFVNSNRYLYTKEVIIKTKNKTYDTRLAGVKNNELLTLENDKIPLDDIISFKIKSRI